MKTALFMIRTRCNYSQSLAAQTVGVSRQLFSAWESGTKQIPTVRKEQLARLFGIDAALLSVSDLTKVEQFCDRPMFSHVIHGRQVFSFAPVGAPRIYLGAPDLHRPEERGNIAIARKNAILQSLDQQITLKPGRPTIFRSWKHLFLRWTVWKGSFIFLLNWTLIPRSMRSHC